MREIKFRAWDRFKKRWVYITLHPSNVQWASSTYTSQHLSAKNVTSDAEGVVFDNLEPWLQFTGLKDKNGKEIYEGDIIEYDKDFQGKPFLDDDGWRFEIGFSCGSFLLLDPYDTGERGGFSGFYLHTPALAVIGNVWENPELLTQGTKE